MADAGAARPRVWVLLGEGAGGNAQMCALADALENACGWPWETRQLHWNRLNHLPNPLLGARRLSLDRHRSDTLAPPWPDLVIAASRRSAPIARWIRRQSGGQTRLVHLLHTQAPLHHFDLVVTLAQFRVPDAPNVLRNTLPLNRADPQALARAEQRWRPVIETLPEPRIGVLVGGNSSSYRLDARTARRLGAHASRCAAKAGGSLLVSTSRRTPGPATRALFDAIDVPSHRYAWQPDDADNPYLGYLALADRFIVTADSASLPAEACASGRPVELFSWSPRRRRLRLPAMVKPLQRSLIYWGFVKPTRDFAAFHDVLRNRGLVDRPQAGTPPDDLARTVSRIRAMMDEH